MTVRGGATEAARVCPFVALDDDRDRRLDHPDHRHRCYAEARPAPRAIAHQEAYCLSPSFPGCPVFQDWANREAASVVRGRTDSASTDRATSEHEPGTPTPIAAVATAAGASEALSAGGGSARRQPVADRSEEIEPGPWDAWTDRGPDGDGRKPAEPERDGRDLDESYPGAIPARRRQPRDWAEPPPWRGAEAGPPDDPNAAPPPFLADRDESPSRRGRERDEPAAASRAGTAGLAGAGLAASSAARAAGGPEPGPDDDDPEDDLGRERTDRRRSIAAGRLRGAERDASVPPWEPRKRSEAYPALKTPMSLPRLGPLAGAVAALAVAALALFFVVPALLNLGSGAGPGPLDGASPSPSVAVSPSASAAPATPAAPTPQVYVIKQGDTLSKIAKKFGLTVDDILQANTATIKDPNKIALGDQIVIPVPSPSDEASEEPASPSPST